MESTHSSLFSTYRYYMDLIASQQHTLLEDINTYVTDLPVLGKNSLLKLHQFSIEFTQFPSPKYIIFRIW